MRTGIEAGSGTRRTVCEKFHRLKYFAAVDRKNARVSPRTWTEEEEEEEFIKPQHKTSL